MIFVNIKCYSKVKLSISKKCVSLFSLSNFFFSLFTHISCNSNFNPNFSLGNLLHNDIDKLKVKFPLQELKTNFY